MDRSVSFLCWSLSQTAAVKGRIDREVRMECPSGPVPGAVTGGLCLCLPDIKADLSLVCIFTGSLKAAQRTPPTMDLGCIHFLLPLLSLEVSQILLHRLPGGAPPPAGDPSS